MPDTQTAQINELREQRDAARALYQEAREAREEAKLLARESIRRHNEVVDRREDAIRECARLWTNYRNLDDSLKQQDADRRRAEREARGTVREAEAEAAHSRPRVAPTTDPQVAAEQVRRGLLTSDDLTADLREQVRELLGVPPTQNEGQATLHDASMMPEDAPEDADDEREEYAVG